MAPRLKSLLGAKYPQFGQQEMERRRRLLSAAAEEAGLDHVLIREAGRAGSAVQWLTGWPVTHEAIVLVTPGERPTLFVDHYNHLPMAERLAVDCEVVWGERRALEVALAALSRRACGRGRLGTIGAMSTGQHERLSDHASELHDLNTAYTRLRLVKSPEEIDWLRVGAHLTDLGLASLVHRLRVGESEHHLADHVERGYVPHGGATLIHFFGVAAMAEPDYCVPRQFTSNRALRRGDVLFTEISGQFWFHPGQVLRTYYIGEDPPALFRELSDVAAAAFDAVAAVLRPGARPEQVVEAASLIEDAGFSVWGRSDARLRRWLSATGDRLAQPGPPAHCRILPSRRE